MTFRDLLAAAASGLFQQKLRTLLTLCGISLGAMLLFCSVSGGLGVLSALQQRLSIGNRLLTIRLSSGWKKVDDDQKEEVKKGLPTTLDDERRDRLASLLAQSTRSDTRQALNLDQVDEIAGWPGVAEITPSLTISQVRFSGLDFRDGVYPGALRVLRTPDASVEELIVVGRMLAGDSAAEVVLNEAHLFNQGYRKDAQFESLIGKTIRLVRTLNPGRMSDDALLVTKNGIAIREKLLDGEITPEQRKFIESDLQGLRARVHQHEQADVRTVESEPLTIVGVFQTPVGDDVASNPSLLSAARSFGFIPLKTGRRFWEDVHSTDLREVRARVLASDTASLRTLLERLKSDGYRCDSLAEVAQRIRSGVLMMTAAITLIACGAFLIAAIGMMNTMIMNVLERRREIGILKSIGARDRDVLWMFLLEGCLIGFLGGLIGLGLGLAATHISGDYIRDFLEKRLDESVGESLFSYPLWLLIGAPLVAGIVTMLASVIPARRAAKLDPVRTLRTL